MCCVCGEQMHSAPFVPRHALFLRPAVSIVIVTNNGHLPPSPRFSVSQPQIGSASQQKGSAKIKPPSPHPRTPTSLLNLFSRYNTTGCYSFKTRGTKAGPDSGPFRRGPFSVEAAPPSYGPAIVSRSARSLSFCGKVLFKRRV